MIAAFGTHEGKLTSMIKEVHEEAGESLDLSAPLRWEAYTKVIMKWPLVTKWEKVGHNTLWTEPTGVETEDAGATTTGKVGGTEVPARWAKRKIRGRGRVSWVRGRSHGKSTA